MQYGCPRTLARRMPRPPQEHSLKLLNHNTTILLVICFLSRRTPRASSLISCPELYPERKNSRHSGTGTAQNLPTNAMDWPELDHLRATWRKDFSESCPTVGKKAPRSRSCRAPILLAILNLVFSSFTLPSASTFVLCCYLYSLNRYP